MSRERQGPASVNMGAVISSMGTAGSDYGPSDGGGGGGGAPADIQGAFTEAIGEPGVGDQLKRLVEEQLAESTMIKIASFGIFTFLKAMETLKDMMFLVGVLQAQQQLFSSPPSIITSALNIQGLGAGKNLIPPAGPQQGAGPG